MLGTKTAEKGLEDVTATWLLRRGLGHQALLGEHQGVFPPRLGDDGAVFHLTIPRARAGWAGGRAGAQAGLGWAGGPGRGPAPAQAPVPETPTPTAVHIPALVPSLGREGRRPVWRAGEPGNGSPGCPQPRSPGGSSGLLSLATPLCSSARSSPPVCLFETPEDVSSRPCLVPTGEEGG